MNIATYVSAISLEPKLMTIAVYHDTKTLENIQATKRCLLQLLSVELAWSVRTLGYTHGGAVDKLKRIGKRTELREHNGLVYLADAAGFVELTEVDQHQVPGADHLLWTGSVVTHKNFNDTEILTTDELRRQKILR
jgi:flavin reductase (DIM6/NTAB) family NADH-FMN oxidoreductase RutF